MKKILIGIMIFFMGVISVSAYNDFTFNYDSPWNEPTSNTLSYDRYTEDVVEIPNGYIRAGVYNKDTNTGYISKLDEQGKIIWKNIISKGNIGEVLVKEDKIYTVTYQNKELYVETYNLKDGQIIKSVKLVDLEEDDVTDFRFYEYQNNIYVIATDIGYLEMIGGFEPKTFNIIDISSVNIKIEDLVGDDYYFYNLSNEYKMGNLTGAWPTNVTFFNGIKKNNYYYMIGVIFDEVSYQYSGIVIKSTLEGNFISKTIIEDIYEFDSITSFDDYLIIGGNTIDENYVNTTGYTYILNENLGIEQIIDVGKLSNLSNTTSTYVSHIIPTKNGIAIAGNIIADNKLDGYLWILTYPFKVLVKESIGGNISSKKNEAYGGDTIEFIVTPEKGYVLGEIKVTDAYGNVIYFKDNKFTMPSADVTIEATFIAKNPNTNAQSIILSIICMIIGGFCIIKAYQKLKWLN